MSLRDDVEPVLRAWNAHETARGAAAIIDYDCHPVAEPVPAEPDRWWVLRRLTDLHQQARDAGDEAVATRVRADLAYPRAVLGERPPLERYVLETQGCVPAGPTDEELDHRRELARAALDGLGIGWGPDLDTELREFEGPLSPEDAADAIGDAAKDLESTVRALVGTDAPYTLTVETADVDAYWAYWLDGAGQHARLRLNLRQARFTAVRARQFALHEVLGHALQFASYAHRAATEDVPWVRIMSVHALNQVLSEGLAQAMPLFVTPEEAPLVARVRLAHYAQLVNARTHLAINEGSTIEACAAEASALVPWWTDGDVADDLADRAPTRSCAPTSGPTPPASTGSSTSSTVAITRRSRGPCTPPTANHSPRPTWPHSGRLAQLSGDDERMFTYAHCFAAMHPSYTGRLSPLW